MKVVRVVLSELYIEKNKPYIVMIFIQFVYAGMSLLSKAAVNDGMNPYIFVVYRQAFATMALAPFAFFIERRSSASLSYILVFKIFLTSLCGIETIAIQQSHGIAKILGSAVGLSGALIFTFVKGPPIYPAIKHKISHYETKSYSREDWIKGSLLMLLANITWSLWIVMQGFLIKQYPAKLRLTTLQIFFSCILSAIWAIINERSIAAWKLGWNVNLLSVLYCGIIVTAITYWLQIWVVEIKGPVFTALFSPLALLITVIFSGLLFKETLHWGRFIFQFFHYSL